MPRSLVTVATDGFRDYVELPDGRTINLGSVSVLKLVASLVRSTSLCKKALDAFLRKGNTLIQVELDDLMELLKPKRSRWAYSNGLIPSLPRQGEGMTDVQDGLTSVSQATQVFESMVSAFDVMYQTPSTETISAFVRSASDFSILVTGSGIDLGSEFNSKESPVDKRASDVTSTSEEAIKTNVEASDNYKLAATEVPLVNEGLVHLVVAKVDEALKVVQASKKKGGEVAKGDLHVISTRLDGLAKTANFQDPTLRSSLLDLVNMADKVRAHFA